MLYFVCSTNNDLFSAVKKSGAELEIASSLAAAVAAAEKGDGILVLADDYPRQMVAVDEKVIETARTKGVRLYLEYFSFQPRALAAAKQAKFERAVISTELFSPVLEKDTILDLHSCFFLPVEVEKVHMYLGRVAGYNKAEFGAPEEKCPLLFELKPGVIAAASSLSGFIRGRYSPHRRWVQLWEQILFWLSGKKVQLEVEPAVRVRAAARDNCPRAMEKEVFDSVRNWFWRRAAYSIDAKKGVIEGLESNIQWDGSQRPRIWPRADCIAELAMVFAYDWKLNNDPASRELASQMLDYIWTHSDFVISDPKSPAYGLLNWYERGTVYYGDDNARAILASFNAAALLEEDRWLEAITRCLLANLKTTGSLGFRHNRITFKELEELGCGHFQKEALIVPSPHFQAYLWAANLWMYALTGDKMFFDKTYKAIEMTMNVYPRWRWTNGLAQELARMILPLAYLLKVEDNLKHRSWLETVVSDLLAHMQPQGGICEFLGALEVGKYPPPRRNEDYGTRESSLIQNDGDPVCDLLYTNNFAFLGLHEAAAAAEDESFLAAENRLAGFLCRIQAVSEKHPELNGVWMRSFDHELWEYWGSNADLSWGAWCVETGWTNSWIASVFGMRLAKQTLFSEKLAPQLNSLVLELKNEFPVLI
ncbi:MAG TPA: hypothetical protein PKI30_00285 [Bacillota bacterium]|nr:hypothetical protein [Bacillota bacterium]